MDEHSWLESLEGVASQVYLNSKAEAEDETAFTKFCDDHLWWWIYGVAFYISYPIITILHAIIDAVKDAWESQ